MIKCPQCKEIYEQSINFCRKCGTAMATAQLADLTALATQELPSQNVASVMTTQLNAETKTGQIKAVESTKLDPLDTWEPSPLPVEATEVLSAAPSLPQTGEPLPPKADATAEPVTPAVPPPATPVAQTSPANEQRAARNGNIAVYAVGSILLLAIVSWVGYRMFGLAPVPAPQETAVAAPSPTPETLVASAETSPAPANTENPEALTKGPKPSPSATPVGSKTVPTPANTNNAALPYSNDNAQTGYTTGASTPNATPASASPVTESATSLIAQGNKYLAAKQFPDAISAYQKARRLDPANVDLHYLLGSAYHQQGQLSEALAHYRQCTSGNYAAVAANHVKNLEKKLSK